MKVYNKISLYVFIIEFIAGSYAFFIIVRLFGLNHSETLRLFWYLITTLVITYIIGYIWTYIFCKPLNKISKYLFDKNIYVDKKAFQSAWESIKSMPITQGIYGTFFGTLLFIITISIALKLFTDISSTKILYTMGVGLFFAIFLSIANYLIDSNILNKSAKDLTLKIKEDYSGIVFISKRISLKKKIIAFCIALTIMPTLLVSLLSHQQYNHALEIQKRMIVDNKDISAISEGLESSTNSFTFSILFITLSSSIFAIIVGIAFSRTFTNSLKEVISSADSISKGKLNKEILVISDDELEDLGWSMYKMRESLKNIIGGIQKSIYNLDTAVRSISHSIEKVSDGSELQAEASEGTLKSIKEVGNAISDISSNIDLLSFSAKEIFGSIIKLNTEVNGIDDNVSMTYRSIDEITTSIEEMNATIKQVAEYSGTLAKAAEETTYETKQMETSIIKVAEAARRTAEVAQEVKRDAQEGWDSVNLTIEGMDKIRESSKTVEEVIGRLFEKVEDIGKVIEVIDTVANQTALLSLNSSILASQVGEQGGKIGALSSEIKTLAERTSFSTREITGKIRDLRRESGNAKDAVQVSAQKVEEGVLLSKKAGEALVKIVESNVRSVSMSNLIAKSTVDQLFMSKRIFKSTEHVFKMAKEISRSMEEQRDGTISLLKAAVNVRDAAQHIKESTSEESDRCSDLSKNIQTINLMIKEINKSVKQQAYESEKVIVAEKDITDITQLNLVSTGELARVVEGLNEQAEVFRRELNKFKIQENA